MFLLSSRHSRYPALASFFRMWQTELGAGSMDGAFFYSMASVVTMLFVYLTED